MSDILSFTVNFQKTLLPFSWSCAGLRAHRTACPIRGWCARTRATARTRACALPTESAWRSPLPWRAPWGSRRGACGRCSRTSAASSAETSSSANTDTNQHEDGETHTDVTMRRVEQHHLSACLPAGWAAASLLWRVNPWIRGAAGWGSSGPCLGACKPPTASPRPERAARAARWCRGRWPAARSEPCLGAQVILQTPHPQPFYRLPGLRAAAHLLLPPIN